MSRWPWWLGLTFLNVLACTSAPPRVVVWAWEAPQDLRFLPPGTGVALLAAEVRVTPGQPPQLHRRAQPATLPEGVVPLAVVRLETHGQGLDPDGLDPLADQLVALVDGWKAAGLQLDFDARQSERADYLRLLRALRARLGTRLLSITGLASWCTEATPWFRDAPVDEVVPQAFRLGPERDAWRARITRGELAPCGTALGVATDEPQAPVPGVRTLYVFHSGAWTAPAFERVAERWR